MVALASIFWRFLVSGYRLLARLFLSMFLLGLSTINHIES
ncbi:hypothetical protein RSAG8_01412, partial [Rhizoctonia solani AG-8 WAC10335]